MKQSIPTAAGQTLFRRDAVYESVVDLVTARLKKTESLEK